MSVEQPICARYTPDRTAPLSLDGYRGNRAIFPTIDAQDSGKTSKTLYSREIGGRTVYIESYTRESVPLSRDLTEIARNGFTIEKWFDPKEKDPLHLHARLNPAITQANSKKITELFSCVPDEYRDEIIAGIPRLRFCADEGIIFEGDSYCAIQIDPDNKFTLKAELETYEPVWQGGERPFRVNLWNPPYFYEAGVVEFKNPDGTVENLVAGFYINKTEPKKIAELLSALPAGGDLDERDLREIMNPYLRLVKGNLSQNGQEQTALPPAADCMNHEVLMEDSWISLDGPSPKGFAFSCEWQNPDNGNPTSKFDRILNLGPVYGEDGEAEQQDEETSTVQTGAPSKDIYVEIKGSASPSEMLQSLIFPSGFVAEEFRERKNGKLHHWDIAIAPQLSKRSQTLAESAFSDLDEEDREEALEDLPEYWPMCSVGEGEGVTVSIGGKYVIEIDDAGSYMVIEGGIEEGEEDGEVEMPFETIDMEGVSEVINGHKYLKYQAEFSLDEILPVEFEEDDVMASWKAEVGVYVRDMGLCQIDSEVRQLLENGRTTQNNLSEYVIPYVRIVDPNLAEV